jgi:hypothetical protein
VTRDEFRKHVIDISDRFKAEGRYADRYEMFMVAGRVLSTKLEPEPCPYPGGRPGKWRIAAKNMKKIAERYGATNWRRDIYQDETTGEVEIAPRMLLGLKSPDIDPAEVIRLRDLFNKQVDPLEKFKRPRFEISTNPCREISLPDEKATPLPLLHLGNFKPEEVMGTVELKETLKPQDTLTGPHTCQFVEMGFTKSKFVCKICDKERA